VDYLRKLRVLRKLTQGNTAVGRPQTYVWDIEKGERGLDTLQVLDLCEAYDLPFPEFAQEFNKRNQPKKK
jgi:transcriptional regulator with XRE-family HTH domain